MSEVGYGDAMTRILLVEDDDTGVAPTDCACLVTVVLPASHPT